MYIYIAASFACDDREETERRKQVINKVVARLRSSIPNGRFYVPHELIVENAWEISLKQWATKVYDTDIAALQLADLVIFLSFGKNNNAGSAWECGYACGRHIPVVAIRLTQDTESVMLFGSARAIIDSPQIEWYDWQTLPCIITPTLFKTQYKLS